MKLSDNYNLKVFFPALASQWHPVKNHDLTPDKVTPGSYKKVWWMCHKGHEWQANIASRKNGTGCPYCSGSKAREENNLLIHHPALAAQWHPVKNGELTPHKVTPYSNLKVWWICEEGHEWQAKIKLRQRGTGCPYCVGRMASEAHNLLSVFPGIASQWHPTKNGSLSPGNVTPHSFKKVWWKCDKGHEWRATIASRSSKGIGCPGCASIRATKEHNLLILNPGIASQWHPTGNRNLTPDKVTPRSRRRVWWMCDNGHEWQDIIKCRTRYGNACPYCYGPDAIKEYNLLTLHPDIAAQWHPFKNGKLTPKDVTPGYNQKAWWLCTFNHEWQASVNNRVIGSNCPYCSGKIASEDYNLSVINPGIAAQWHPSKNGELTPARVLPYARRKVWWLCDKGHEWQTTITNRSRGTGCPYCAGKKK